MASEKTKDQMCAVCGQGFPAGASACPVCGTQVAKKKRSKPTSKTPKKIAGKKGTPAPPPASGAKSKPERGQAPDLPEWLTSLPGLSDEQKQSLYSAGFVDRASLGGAIPEEVSALPGFDGESAKALLDSLSGTEQPPAEESAAKGGRKKTSPPKAGAKTKPERGKAPDLPAEISSLPGLNDEQKLSLYSAGFVDHASLAGAFSEEVSALPGFDVESAKALLDGLSGAEQTPTEESAAKGGRKKTSPPKGGAKAKPVRGKAPDLPEEISSLSDLTDEQKQSLYSAGFVDRASLEGALIEEVSSLPGFDVEGAKALLDSLPGGEPTKGGKSPKAGGGKQKGTTSTKESTSGTDDAALKGWLGGGDQKPDIGAKLQTEGIGALKDWLTGDEESLENWLGIEEEPKAADSQQISADLKARQAEIKEKQQEVEKHSVEIETLIGENQKLKELLEKSLTSIETGQFDPIQLLEDYAQVSRELQVEKRGRKELEEEIAHVKKGSLAVVKYVKAQQNQLRQKELGQYKTRLVEEVTQRKKLAIALAQTAEKLKVNQQQLKKKVEALPADKAAAATLEARTKELEVEIKARDAQIKNLENSLASREKVAGTKDDSNVQELQARFESELGANEKAFTEREEELKKHTIDLEYQISQLKIDVKLSQESSEIRQAGSGEEISEEIKKKEVEMLAKEKGLLIREEEIDRLKNDLEFANVENKKWKQRYNDMQSRLNEHEHDLQHREQVLQEERKRYDAAKRESGSMESHEMKLKLETLKEEVARKEDEIRTKEKFLMQKMEELKRREKGVIEDELEAREEDRELEWKVEKVKTGDRRLDELMYGGIPFGSNVMLYGPPFTGKEVLANAFIAEGLKKGVPAIYVLTEKSASEIRDEMQFIFSGFEEYERLGLVKYVDVYSVSMGDEPTDEYTIYLDDPGDAMGIMKEVDKIAKEFSAEHHYYRLCFRSVSPLTAYIEPNQAFRFLQPFAGKRRKAKAVSFYIFEKGMHSEQEIQMLSSPMDGSFDFMVKNLETYICVKGVTDVQSNTYIKYTHSKSGLVIGSFSLGKIR